MKELTPEQLAHMDKVAKEWLDLCVNCEFDEKGIADGIEWLYEISGLDKPKVLTYKSPMEIQKAANEICGTMDKFYAFSESLLFDSYWVAFYDFFRQIGVVNNDDFVRYIEYLKAGPGATVLLEDHALVCPVPEYIHRDDRDRLHCEDGPTIAWPGYAQYYVHGVNFTNDQELFNKAFIDGHMKGEEILQIRNAEQKAVIIAFYGYDIIINSIEDAKVIDEYVTKSKITGKPTTYQVIDFPLDGNTFRVVKVECHTEHKVTTLGVPIQEDTEKCMGAIAWTFDMTEDQYKLHAES